MLYYANFLETIQQIPFEKLKYADEAHVVARDLETTRVLGLTGKRSYIKEASLHVPSASLSLMISLTHDIPFFIDYRYESNNQWNFCDFVYLACQQGYLQKSDYLIVDNASVHSGLDSQEILKEILDTFGVRIIKMPVYSPELNPCELVFSQVKRYIRNHKLLNNRSCLWQEVVSSLSKVKKEQLYNYYIKCVCPKVILPDFFDVQQQHVFNE